METYMVGGAVRDILLGKEAKDRDFVVVGVTPDQMIAAGYMAVGKDFPVFLHPITREEYGLARTERKTSPGYKGFVFHTDCDVSLEDDLARRDLTVNAMAQAEDGSLIDPFGGQRDLKEKIFRHVSPAFTEDPVRILRLARFAARFPEFSVAPETNDLMRKMVDIGEIDALVPERVWQELSRGLMEEKPSRMFEVLRGCKALKHILPELDALWGVPQPAVYHPEIDTGAHVMLVIDYAARRDHALAVRWAALLHDLGKGATPPASWPSHHGHEGVGATMVEEVCLRLKVPGDCRDLALMTAREHGNVGRAMQLRPATIVTLFERCDAFRRPQRFVDMLHASACDHFGRTGFENIPYPQFAYLQTALREAQMVDAGHIAQVHSDSPQRIPIAVHDARVDAIRKLVDSQAGTPDL